MYAFILLLVSICIPCLSNCCRIEDDSKSKRERERREGIERRRVKEIEGKGSGRERMKKLEERGRKEINGGGANIEDRRRGIRRKVEKGKERSRRKKPEMR